MRMNGGFALWGAMPRINFVALLMQWAMPSQGSSIGTVQLVWSYMLYGRITISVLAQKVKGENGVDHKQSK
jgi:hypothetical protein